MFLFTHLLAGILPVICIIYFYPSKKIQALIIGTICSLLPDIDIFFVDIFSIEHRGVLHDPQIYFVILMVLIVVGIIIEIQRETFILMLLGFFNIFVHIFLDWGFSEHWDETRELWWQSPRVMGAINPILDAQQEMINIYSLALLCICIIITLSLTYIYRSK